MSDLTMFKCFPSRHFTSWDFTLIDHIQDRLDTGKFTSTLAPFPLQKGQFKVFH